jgi:CO/xanthine dehydrogenase FAD-binding subunit
VAGIATEPVIAVDVVDGLVGQQPDQALVEQLAAEFAADLKPPADLHGTAEYRRQLVRHLLPRAVDQSVRAALT